VHLDQRQRAKRRVDVVCQPVGGLLQAALGDGGLLFCQPSLREVFEGLGLLDSRRFDLVDLLLPRRVDAVSCCLCSSSCLSRACLMVIKGSGPMVALVRFPSNPYE